MPPLALVGMGFGEVGQRRVPGQLSDAVLSPQRVVLVEHCVLEDLVIQKVVVVLVFDSQDVRVVDDADKPGVDREGDGGEDEGQQEEEEERCDRR